MTIWWQKLFYKHTCIQHISCIANILQTTNEHHQTNQQQHNIITSRLTSTMNYISPPKLVLHKMPIGVRCTDDTMTRQLTRHIWSSQHLWKCNIMCDKNSFTSRWESKFACFHQIVRKNLLSKAYLYRLVACVWKNIVI